MGIGRYFAVLGAILGFGLLVTLYLLLRRSKRAALWGFAATVFLGAGWYVSIIVDSFASVVIFPHDTIYAVGYSEKAFRQVRSEEPRGRVLALLGEPLSRSDFSDDHTEYWYYSKHGPRYDTYWNKIVVFDADTGRVIRKVDEFYSD